MSLLPLRMRSGWIRGLTVTVTAALLGAGCSPVPRLAKTAVPSDFDGAWKGEWDWEKGSVTTLEIRAGRAKYINLPVHTLAAGMPAVSGEGGAEFQKEWSIRAPCVLVITPHGEVPVYITAGKDGLFYPAHTSGRKHIVFARK